MAKRRGNGTCFSGEDVENNPHPHLSIRTIEFNNEKWQSFLPKSIGSDDGAELYRSSGFIYKELWQIVATVAVKIVPLFFF